MEKPCPTCGALYTVEQRHIGRRIRCKKCQTPLVVTTNGLEIDQPVATPPAPVEADDAFDTGDDAVVAPRRGRDRARRYGGAGFDLNESLAKIGGVPTLLFGFGTFLVIFTGFMPRIAEAKIDRRQGAILQEQSELAAAERAYNERKERKSEDDKRMNDRREESRKRVAELQEEVTDARVAALRSKYWDRYFLMFGFLLVAFGSLGYLRTEQPLTLRIVAAIVLTAVLLIIFLSVGGCEGGGRSVIPSGKGFE
jgi:hypothetical protein